MAARRRRSAPKAEKGRSCPCCNSELGRIEAGLLLLIGLVWVLQVLGTFTFGGQYFQIIGSVLVLVIGATKFVSAGQCRC